MDYRSFFMEYENFSKGYGVLMQTYREAKSEGLSNEDRNVLVNLRISEAMGLPEGTDYRMLLHAEKARRSRDKKSVGKFDTLSLGNLDLSRMTRVELEGLMQRAESELNQRPAEYRGDYVGVYREDAQWRVRQVGRGITIWRFDSMEDANLIAERIDRLCRDIVSSLRRI